MQLSEFFYILYILCTVFWPSLIKSTSVCPAKVIIRHSPFQPRHEALAESSLRLNSHYYNEVTRIQFPALMLQRISFFCRSGVNIKIWPFQIRPGSAFMYSPRLDTYPVWCLVTWMRASDWNSCHFFPPNMQITHDFCCHHLVLVAWQNNQGAQQHWCLYSVEGWGNWRFYFKSGESSKTGRNLLKLSRVWSNCPRNLCKHVRHFRGCVFTLKTDYGSLAVTKMKHLKWIDPVWAKIRIVQRSL